MDSAGTYLVCVEFLLSEEDSQRLLKELGCMYPQLRPFLTDTKEAMSVLDDCLQRKDGVRKLKEWFDSRSERKAPSIIQTDPTREPNGTWRPVPRIEFYPDEQSHHKIKVYRYGWTNGVKGPDDSDVVHYTWWIDCNLSPTSERAEGLMNLITEWMRQPMVPGSGLDKVGEVLGAPLFIHDNKLCRYTEIGDGEFGFEPQIDPYIPLEVIEGETLRDLIRSYNRFSMLSLCPLLVKFAEVLNLAHADSVELGDVTCNPDQVEIMAKHYEAGDSFLASPEDTYNLVEGIMKDVSMSDGTEPGTKKYDLMIFMTERLKTMMRINLQKTIPSYVQLEDWIQALLQVERESELSLYEIIEDSICRNEVWKRFLYLSDRYTEYMTPQTEVAMSMLLVEMFKIVMLRHAEMDESEEKQQEQIDRLSNFLDSKLQPPVLVEAAACWMEEQKKIIFGFHRPKLRNKGSRSPNR